MCIEKSCNLIKCSFNQGRIFYESDLSVKKHVLAVETLKVT